MEFILAISLGIMIGFVLALPAIILEIDKRVKNLPLLVDVAVIWGKKLNEREVFAASLLLHFIISGLYALFYVIFAENAWLFITNAPYTLGSMLIFAFLSWLVLNIAIFPLLGFGIWGGKEGDTVWLETLISLLLEGAIFWVLIHYY
ncbi:hypothetical protein D6827_02260, partial [Candidatus Parcubacteria bacterium]